MGTWFSKILGDGMTAYEPSDEIEKAFEPLFRTAGQPADMAVFIRHVSEGHLQCQVSAYFSPATAELARAFAAEPCIKPARDGLVLLAGDGRCWPVLFADGDNQSGRLPSS